jgi:hypothetical protein
MLGFEFDERFAPRMDEESRRLICRVRSMRDRGATYRVIAKELGISRSQAGRLYKKWTPAMDGAQRSANSSQDEPEEWEEADLEQQPVWLEADESDAFADEDARATASNTQDRSARFLPASGALPDAVVDDGVLTPQAAFAGKDACAPVSVYDLKRGVDGYDREIFIESEDESTGKPKVWYQFNKQGIKVRYEFKNFGFSTSYLGSSPYL